MSRPPSTSLDSELLARRGFTIFLRLMAAVAVLASHARPLSGSGTDPLVGSSPLGEVAVSVFFVLSGYFIFSSSLKHKFLVFILLRCARLFPALFVANFFFAFVIGPVISFQDNEKGYWTSAEGPFAYLTSNSTLLFGLQPSLASTFSDNPYPYVINGSLWTLPTELKCYILCACIGFLVKASNHIWPLYISVVALSVLYIFSAQGTVGLDQIVPISTLRLSLIFFSGALVTKMSFHDSRIMLMFKISIVAFLYAVLFAPTSAPFFYWILLPTIALVPNFVSSKFGFFNQRDFSYGFYLWAFPVQQLTIHFDLATTALSLLMISSLITMLFAVGSWYLVELPSIQHVRKLVKSQE